MEIVQSGDRLVIQAFAKVNLFLEVLGRRPDGYHEIDSFFQLIDLADEVTLQEAPTEISVGCSDSSIPEKENLVFRAAEALRREVGGSQGVRIEVRKRIPSGAGLGGGSSDAAATLAGLNLLWDLKLDRAELMAIGATVGSDVPFFFHGGVARVRGRGEDVAPLATTIRPYYLLACPPISVPTARVYQQLSEELTGEREDGSIMLEALLEEDVGRVGRGLFNRLQDVALRLYPALGAIVDELARQPSCGVLMTGSGSSVFALYDTLAKAQTAYESLQHQSAHFGIYLAAGR